MIDRTSNIGIDRLFIRKRLTERHEPGRPGGRDFTSIDLKAEVAVHDPSGPRGRADRRLGQPTALCVMLFDTAETIAAITALTRGTLRVSVCTASQRSTTGADVSVASIRFSPGSASP